MPTQSRRRFLQALSTSGAGAAAFAVVGGRGFEARLDLAPGSVGLINPQLLRLDSNENPNGPAPQALEALRSMFGEANRYPDATDLALTSAIARRHNVPEDHVVLGAGSGEILSMITQAFTGPGKSLISATPTFEVPARTATRMGVEVRAPRVTASLGLDLDAMLAAARGGTGLLFICNPNNPTGTVHPASTIREFVRRFRAAAPDASVLIDEAYFEYVDDPSYDTALDLALADEKVIIARTFSKVFGLAGLRIGYAVARPSTIARLAPWRVSNGISTLGAAAAIASIPLSEHIARERRINSEAREFTRRELGRLGFEVPKSHTNFVMFNARRDVARLREACASAGLAIGRVFEPLTTHARVSIGTMDEMRTALPMLATALRA
ncbi:MAG: pyridoxal phosphate-dependent aminotransferase [Gemmatimonadota bacterium]